MKIRDQVYLISFTSSIVPLVLLAMLTFFTLEYELRRSEEEKLELLFTRGEMYLNDMFTNLDSRLEMLSDIYLDHDADEVQEYMDIFSQRSDGVEYFAFGSEEGRMYVGEKTPDFFPEEYDPRERPWYEGALNTDGYFLSEVFVHAITGAPAVTISKRVIANGRIEGVMAALINISNIERALIKNKSGRLTDFFVVNGRGDLLIDTGESHKIFEKYRDDFVGLTEEEGVTIEYRGQPRFYHSHVVPGINLTIIGGILEEQLMAPVARLQKIMLFMVVLTISISAILTLVFGRRFANSLSRLSHIIDNIARGNYSKNIVKLTDFIDVNSELYLVKEGIKRMQEEIRSREARLKMISETDPLTKIFNRGAIMDLIEMELQRSNTFGTEFSLIMFDLDHFKNLNDTYGHQFGDEVLQEVTKTALETLKKVDVIGRYGGEEFLILLPDTELDGGRATAERVRSMIMNLKWRNEVQVTASFGVTHCCGGGEELGDLLTSVDSLLYRAKKKGRNRVEVSRKI